MQPAVILLAATDLSPTNESPVKHPSAITHSLTRPHPNFVLSRSRSHADSDQPPPMGECLDTPAHFRCDGEFKEFVNSMFL